MALQHKLIELSDHYDTHYLALQLNDYGLSATEIEEVLDILTILADTDIELVSYGLAPNPNGFCYEIPEDLDYRLKPSVTVLNQLLDGLNKNQESFLKAWCL